MKLYLYPTDKFCWLTHISRIFRLGVWIFPRLQRNKQRKVIVWRNFTTRKSSKVVHFYRKTCWPHGTETETQVLMKNISHYSEPKRINEKSSFNLVIKTALGNNLRKLLQLTKNVQPPRPRHMRISKIKDYRSPSSWRISVFQSSVYLLNAITSFYCFRPVEEPYLLDESKIWSRIGKQYRGLTQTEKQTSIWTFQNKEGFPWTTKEDYVRESTIWFLKRLDQKLSFLN